MDIVWRIDKEPIPENIRIKNWDKNQRKDKPFFEADETFLNRFYFMSLGSEITILYPRDIEEVLDDFEAVYKESDVKKYIISPMILLNVAYDFYQIQLTKENLQALQEADIEPSHDYTLAEAEAGEVKWLNMLGNRINFDGYLDLRTATGGGYEIQFVS